MSRPKNADAGETRWRVLGAARQIAVEQGLRGLTIDAVASKAGVSKGTAGQFKIDALVEDVIDSAFVPLIAEMNQPAPRVEGEEVSYQNRIDALFLHEPEAAALVVQACSLGSTIRAEGSSGMSLRARFAGTRASAERLIAEGARVGQPEDWAKRVVSYYLTAAVRASVPS